MCDLLQREELRTHPTTESPQGMRQRVGRSRRSGTAVMGGGEQSGVAAQSPPRTTRAAAPSVRGYAGKGVLAAGEREAWRHTTEARESDLSMRSDGLLRGVAAARAASSAGDGASRGDGALPAGRGRAHGA